MYIIIQNILKETCRIQMATTKKPRSNTPGLLYNLSKVLLEQFAHLH